MAVTASQLDKMALLRKARARLYNGIIDHDDEKVRKAIAEIPQLGGDLNQPWTDMNEDHRSPIGLAAYAHNLEAMRLLLNTNTIDLNFETRGKVPVMVDVCRTGDERVVDRLLRSGASINTQASFNVQPLDEAFFASMKFDYSLIFHSDWGDLSLKGQLIAWWEGKGSPPSAPLKAHYPGPIPLIARLLKEGADPAIERSSGLSPLKVVRDPSCILKNEGTRMAVELDDRVKLLGIKDDILTFKVVLQNRTNEKTLGPVIVELNYNFPLPKDVDERVTTSVFKLYEKNRTMRVLIEEAYASKEKSKLHSVELSDIKRRVEKVEIQTTTIVKKVDGLHDQHVIMWEQHTVQEAYQKRLETITAVKDSPQYEFFNTIAQELNRLFMTCKLHMKDPDKLDQGALAAKGINALSEFLPAPFNTPGKAVAFLVQTYSDYRLDKERKRVAHLLPVDHISMCIDLALQLTEQYRKEIMELSTEKAEKLGKTAVGAIFVLMCDPKKTINPKSSFEQIEKELFETVCKSKLFHEKLEEYRESVKSPRSWMPAFLKGKNKSADKGKGTEPPRSSSQPPRPVAKPTTPTISTTTQPEHTPPPMLTSYPFSRPKSPESAPPVVTSQSPRCKPPAPSLMRNPPNLAQSVT